MAKDPIISKSISDCNTPQQFQLDNGDDESLFDLSLHNSVSLGQWKFGEHDLQQRLREYAFLVVGVRFLHRQ